MPLRKAYSDRERERALLHALLLTHGGEATAWALERLEPLAAFRLMRRLSRLTIHLPEDAPIIEPLLPPGTVGTDRLTLTFPDFQDFHKLVAEVQCYFLSLKYTSRRLTAEALGWSESDVKNAIEKVQNWVRKLGGAV